MRLIFLVLLTGIATSLNAQTVSTRVTSLSGQEVIPTRQTKPLFPPIAQAAQISGEVKVHIEVAPDGHVSSAKVISGPPMLNQSALDSVRTWLFASPSGGASGTADVYVNYRLPVPDENDDAIQKRFFPLLDACTTAVTSHADPNEQASKCQAAADVASTFGPKSRYIEKRRAYDYTSTAMRRAKRYPDALAYANKAVSIVEEGHDDGSGTGSAYGARAQAEAETGDLHAASADLSKAEDAERDAIAKMQADNHEFVTRAYVPVLKQMLLYHAQVLSALGDAAGSRSKLDEANKL